MNSITIHTTDQEKDLILKSAASAGLSVSGFIKRIVLEKIENEYDTQIGLEALEEYRKNPVSYTFEELKESLHQKDSDKI